MADTQDIEASDKKGAPVRRAIKGNVVIRRSRRRRAAAAGGDGSAAYHPKVKGVFTVTAVDVKPDALASFDPSPFAYATVPEMVDVPDPPPVVEPEVAAEVEPVAAAPAVEDVETPAEVEAPVADQSSEAVAAPSEEEAAAPVAKEPEAPAVDEPVAVAEAPAEASVETPAEAPPAPPAESVDEVYGRKVSAEAAEKINAELLSAAERAERGDDAADDEAEAKPKPGPRVLGRIDLKKKTTPSKPAQPAVKKPDEPGTGDADTRGRKRKRKVVRKEDMFDALERSYQMRPRKRRAAPGQKVRKTEVTTPKASKRIVKVNELITPGELARSMGVKAGEVLGAMMRLGVMKSINDMVDIETAELVADEFGYKVENTAVNVDALLESGRSDETEVKAQARPPVVTVMGHVDHGKTSLLDSIRNTSVISGESGGITQHIGAYMVPTSHGEVCFLDTPGHAAFTAMRARGASVTDIVVLVTAADDGVMPQTVEAVNHAKAAGLPIVVAVNKMDKPDANPDRVKQQLSDLEVVPEDWGGTTQFLPVSALKGEGVAELLEAVALQAELLELEAPTDVPAEGIVIEARLDKGRGPVATVLVQRGTLNRGDHFVVGEATGRIRAMHDHNGRQIKEAPPSHPAEIIGLSEVPAAGDSFVVVEDPSKAQQVAELRKDSSRKQQLAASTRMSLEDLQAAVASGQTTELRVIIKADVDGSVEAIRQALEKLSTAEVSLNVIHGAVGAIIESDVQLAMASQAIIVGFHVRPEAKARKQAENEGVDIRLHSVIYEIVDEVRAALEGLLAPDFREAFMGRIQVRDTFSTPAGTIAGCYVAEGEAKRNAACRLVRDGVVVYQGKIGSLRRFKDDVREVKESYECGVGLDRFNDVKVGDEIECYSVEEVKRTLDDATAVAAEAAAVAAESAAE